MSTQPLAVRVYWEDTDAGGVVYYANYLKFAERARTEALRAAGLEQPALLSTHGIAFVVRRCNVEFLKPARLDDRLTITSALEDIKNASVTLAQTIQREGETLVMLTVQIAAVGADFKPARLPEDVRTALAAAFSPNPSSTF